VPKSEKPKPDLREWFSESELADCPRCSQRSALPIPKGGFVVCLDCGVVRADGTHAGDRAAAARLNETTAEPAAGQI
jgi:hypothetical protein